MDAIRAPRAEMSLFGEYVAPTPEEIRAISARVHRERAETVVNLVKIVVGFVAGHVASFLESLQLAVAREQVYRRLVMMDDSALARIGITRDQIADYVLGTASAVPTRPVAVSATRVSPSLETAVQSPSAPMPSRSQHHREAA